MKSVCMFKRLEVTDFDQDRSTTLLEPCWDLNVKPCCKLSAIVIFLSHGRITAQSQALWDGVFRADAIKSTAIVINPVEKIPF